MSPVCSGLRMLRRLSHTAESGHQTATRNTTVHHHRGISSLHCLETEHCSRLAPTSRPPVSGTVRTDVRRPSRPRRSLRCHPAATRRRGQRRPAPGDRPCRRPLPPERSARRQVVPPGLPPTARGRPAPPPLLLLLLLLPARRPLGDDGRG